MSNPAIQRMTAGVPDLLRFLTSRGNRCSMQKADMSDVHDLMCTFMLIVAPYLSIVHAVLSRQGLDQVLQRQVPLHVVAEPYAALHLHNANPKLICMWTWQRRMVCALTPCIPCVPTVLHFAETWHRFSCKEVSTRGRSFVPPDAGEISDAPAWARHQASFQLPSEKMRVLWHIC